MIYFAQLQYHSRYPDVLIGIVAVSVLYYCLGLFLQRLRVSPTTPDPWDDQVAAAIENDDAVPLCHHCLAPHSAAADFCPECGAAVGEYTNLLPYPYLFSVGHALRIGAFGNFKRSPLTVAGFLALGFIEYSVFAPFYWFRLLRNIFYKPQSGSTSDQPPTETAPDAR